MAGPHDPRDQALDADLAAAIIQSLSLFARPSGNARQTGSESQASSGTAVTLPDPAASRSLSSAEPSPQAWPLSPSLDIALRAYQEEPWPDAGEDKDGQRRSVAI
ncbi:hypothetical protein [Mesorhizobium xinjiangense]|uniref:hypothetical protein n=1 Tax=Mesorhizobium xinjiangense TaxID=2678685 RepID=UPI0012ED748A|nr:hypothetical protein [Mesorhizobium xinjiangense]